MSLTGDFLGLCHSLEHIREGVMPLWVRQRLQDKILDIIQLARSTNYFPKGVAAKFYGCTNFLENATWGRIGRAGLQAVVERQYSSETAVTRGIDTSFDMIKSIILDKPQRLANIFLSEEDSKFVVASDASLESPRLGGGGYLLLNHPNLQQEQRLAFLVDKVHYDD